VVQVRIPAGELPALRAIMRRAKSSLMSAAVIDPYVRTQLRARSLAVASFSFPKFILAIRGYTISNKSFYESKIQKQYQRRPLKAAFGILRMFRVQSYEGVNEG